TIRSCGGNQPGCSMDRAVSVPVWSATVCHGLPRSAISGASTRSRVAGGGSESGGGEGGARVAFTEQVGRSRTVFAERDRKGGEGGVGARKGGNAKRRERWLSAFGVNPRAGLARCGLSGSPRRTLFVRNSLGDALGKDSSGEKPSPLHAELAVNLAGAI